MFGTLLNGIARIGRNGKRVEQHACAQHKHHGQKRDKNDIAHSWRDVQFALHILCKFPNGLFLCHAELTDGKDVCSSLLLFCMSEMFSGYICYGSVVEAFVKYGISQHILRKL